MATGDVLTSMVKIFLLLIPGFLLRKIGKISEEQTKGVSSIITNVTYPCMVIAAMQMEYSPVVLNNCKYAALIYAGIVVIAFLVSKAAEKVIKLPKSQSGILAFMLIFGNTGFLGLPVLNTLFGSEAVFYGAICSSTCDVFMFTFGIALIRASAGAEQGQKPSVKETLTGILNPCVLSMVIGITLFVLRIMLPPIIGEPVAMVGATTTPLALFVVGSQLAAIPFKELFSGKLMYLFSFLRLLVMPLLALALVKPVIGTDSLLAVVIVMETAMPAAMITVIFSQLYGGDVKFATKGVLVSTLLCILTIPIVAILVTGL